MASKCETDDISYLSKFLKDENNEIILINLRSILYELRFGHSNLTAGFLRVEDTNATTSISFKNAWCDISRMDDERTGLPFVIPIAFLFMNGYFLLKNFLDKDNPKLPEDATKRRALKQLLQFIASDHSRLLEDRSKKEKEWEVAHHFMKHLMMPLVPFKTFCIDNELERKCLSVEDQQCKIGDTSFGCACAWHGRANILVEAEMPFTVSESSEELEETSQYSETSVDGKQGESFTAEQQILAQAITFSFFRVNTYPCALNHSLVPGLGIYKDKLIIYLYDCDEDVLLETFPLNLFLAEKVLDKRMVIVLWLTLNYNLFGSGLSEDIKKYKSGFHQRLGPNYLEAYRRTNKHPVNLRSAKRQGNKSHRVLPLIDCEDYLPPNENLISPVDVL